MTRLFQFKNQALVYRNQIPSTQELVLPILDPDWKGHGGTNKFVSSEQNKKRSATTFENFKNESALGVYNKLDPPIQLLDPLIQVQNPPIQEQTLPFRYQFFQFRNESGKKMVKQIFFSLYNRKG